MIGQTRTMIDLENMSWALIVPGKGAAAVINWGKNA